LSGRLAVILLAVVYASATVPVTSDAASPANPSGAPTLRPSTRPGMHNSGPTDPTVLRAVDDVLEVGADGAVVENVEARRGIRILADDVTIRNFISRGSVTVVRGVGTVLEDGEVAAHANVPAVQGSNFTARRLNVHHVHDGFRIGGNVVIEACYVHDLGHGGGGHTDGIQAIVTPGPVIIRNNFIDAANATSAINNVQDDWTVEGNWLDAYGYAIFFNPEAAAPRVINNRFGGRAPPDRYRPTGAAWTGNVRDDTGRPLP
jgi:hypothetical protein